MTLQEKALLDLARCLEEHRIAYMVIGGIANAAWGEPRSTLDIDVTIAAEPTEVVEIANALGPDFRPLVSDIESFVQETRVLPLASHSGVRVDLIFGVLPFEREAIERAKPLPIADDEVVFCTPEDLILLKIISQREQDQADVRGILQRRFEDLDFEYLEPRIRELSELLSRPEILHNWSRWQAELN